MNDNFLWIRALKNANNVNYEKEVKEKINNLKEMLVTMNSNYSIKLHFDYLEEIQANTEEEVVIKITKYITNYRIKEKALVELVKEGIVYPVAFREVEISGNEINVSVNGSNYKQFADLKKYVFSEFIKS